MASSKVKEIIEAIKKIAAEDGFKMKQSEQGLGLFIYLEKDYGVQEVGLPIQIIDGDEVYTDFSTRHLYINKIVTDFTLKDGYTKNSENICTLSFEEMEEYLKNNKAFEYQSDIFILAEEFRAFDSLIKRLSKFFASC